MQNAKERTQLKKYFNTLPKFDKKLDSQNGKTFF